MAPTSRRGADRRRRALAVGVLLVLVLGLLAAMQARWLGDLARAQREETRRVLQAAAHRMALDCQAALAQIEESLTRGAEGLEAPLPKFVDEVVHLGTDVQPNLEAPAFVAHGVSGERVLVVLDVEQLTGELFPSLVAGAFGAAGLDSYRVSIVAVDGDQPPLYRSHASTDPLESEPDASADLLLQPNRWTGFLGDGEGSWTALDTPIFVLAGEDADPRVVDLSQARWRIEVRHRAGSLEVALAQARTRNFLLGGAVLALLIAGFAFLWIAEQRARRLAEKELAFVAGVSHELRTPLAVARTAASNLERGIVTSTAQTTEYGALIGQEVQRVSALVERVLRFSGDPGPPELDDVDVGEMIQAAVERCRPWRDRRRFEVAIEVDESARTVRADGAALTSAVHNLIENAIKYGEHGQTIRVDARRSPEFVLQVADSGPGVARADRARVFEPFYRGAHHSDGIPGSGLGLAVASDIAKAHGGRLELLEPAEGSRGATFALRLPPPPMEELD